MQKLDNKGRGYSGYEKTPLYLYDNKGKYIQKYNSKGEFCEEFFNNEKYPLFQTKTKNSRNYFGYQLLPNGNFICNFKCGREHLRKCESIVNSEFCQNLKDDKIIECFNLSGDKIAEFLSFSIAYKMTNISKSTIYSILKGDNKKKTKCELVFKYKKI